MIYYIVIILFTVFLPKTFFTQELDFYLFDDHKIFERNDLAKKYHIKSINIVRLFDSKVDTIGYTEFDKKAFINRNFEAIGNYKTSYSINRFSKDSMQVILLYKNGDEIIEKSSQVFSKNGFVFKKYLLVESQYQPNGEYKSLLDYTGYVYNTPKWDTYYKYYNGTIDSSRTKVKDTLVFTVTEKVGDSMRITVRKNYKNLFIDIYDTEVIKNLVSTKCRHYEVYDNKKRVIKKYSNCSNGRATDSAVTVIVYEYDDKKKSKKKIEYHLNSDKIKAATTYDSRENVLEYYQYVFAAKDEIRVAKLKYNKMGFLEKELFYINNELRKTVSYRYSFY
jgi:hypothetical protein